MEIRMHRFIAALFALAALCGAGVSHAQRYAVISLIGDRMQLAFARGVDGQPVDRIERRYIPLDDSSIDRATLLAANEQIKQLKPGSDPVLLQAFERSYFDVDAGTSTIVEWIRQLVRNQKGAKVTHAVIITKIQYEGVPALQKAFVGSGTLEGMGFFVGREAAPASMGPNAAGPGFLAPFAYFRVSLVDLATGQVVREDKGLASTMLSATATDTGNPWDTLSGTQKVEKLMDLVRKELAIILPKVLKAS
jgi:hypothetical protein